MKPVPSLKHRFSQEEQTLFAIDIFREAVNSELVWIRATAQGEMSLCQKQPTISSIDPYLNVVLWDLELEKRNNNRNVYFLCWDQCLWSSVTLLFLCDVVLAFFCNAWCLMPNTRQAASSALAARWWQRDTTPRGCGFPAHTIQTESAGHKQKSWKRPEISTPRDSNTCNGANKGSAKPSWSVAWGLK